MIRTQIAPDTRVRYLVGHSASTLNARPTVPYDDLVCDFLGELSTILLSDATARQFPDVISFAYWCRRSNISKLKSEFNEYHIRLGIGNVFHIAPSNVPVNFVFSYALSLLAGNVNLVRVPSKEFPQTEIICVALNHVFKNEKYGRILGMTAMVQYAQEDEITAAFSASCNARIIWGGDQAINNIRRLPIPERAIEIAFADRYSFCVIGAERVLLADTAAMHRLAEGFYNDTYLMDQNACSSPHLVVWIGQEEVVQKAKDHFWKNVYKIAAVKYDLQPVNAIDKYMILCKNAIEMAEVTNFQGHGNFVYRTELETLPGNIDDYRGKFGYFYEFRTENIDEIAHIVNKKYQTLTYYGVEKSLLIDYIMKNRLSGIDRVVPVGKALDIGVFWDGYDIVRTLSRIIDVR